MAVTRAQVMPPPGRGGRKESLTAVAESGADTADHPVQASRRRLRRVVVEAGHAARVEGAVEGAELSPALPRSWSRHGHGVSRRRALGLQQQPSRRRRSDSLRCGLSVRASQIVGCRRSRWRYRARRRRARSRRRRSAAGRACSGVEQVEARAIAYAVALSLVEAGRGAGRTGAGRRRLPRRRVPRTVRRPRRHPTPLRPGEMPGGVGEVERWRRGSGRYGPAAGSSGGAAGSSQSPQLDASVPQAGPDRRGVRPARPTLGHGVVAAQEFQVAEALEDARAVRVATSPAASG